MALSLKPNDLSGGDLLGLGKSAEPSGKSHAEIFVKPKAGGGQGGGGSLAGQRAREEAKKQQEVKAWDEATTGLGEHAPQPVEDPTEIKEKAHLKKVGWVEPTTEFKTDAKIFAEFFVPESIRHRTRVDFQLLLKKNGKFIKVEDATGHVDSSGRAVVTVPIRKPAASEEQRPPFEEPGKPSAQNDKAIFAIQAKHCSADSTEWSKESGTEREVTKTGEAEFKHTLVSGLHFLKNKSFVPDTYLDVFTTLKKAYAKWKSEHDSIAIVVYGHAEPNEAEPLKLSRNRARAAQAYLMGDLETWERLANEEKWGTYEYQCMLRALGYLKCKPTGNYLGLTKKAVQAFIADMNEKESKGLDPVSGLDNSRTRTELYRAYLAKNREHFEIPRVKFREVSGFPFVGCGCMNRFVIAKGHQPENRRVTFLIVSESQNFPKVFPCRVSSSAPCDHQAKQDGKRGVEGFKCKFYDDLSAKEKTGNACLGCDDIETNWKGLPHQNDFNDIIVKAALQYNFEPIVLKSLIAQESGFNKLAKNPFGFAGLTQVGGSAIHDAGLNIGSTSKSTGKWVYDLENDERFNAEKSIFAGAKILDMKRKSIDSMVFKQFKNQIDDDEKMKFYLAAYNGGEGTVRNAWKSHGMKDCTWGDLVTGELKDTALWKSIPESWGRDDKFEEISNYVTDIIARAK